MNTCNIVQVVQAKKSGILDIDARTKIILMILGNMAVFFASNIQLEIILVTSYLIFGFLCGAYNIPGKIALGYFSLLLLGYFAGIYLNGIWKLMLITFSQFMCIILPCALLASIISEKEILIFDEPTSGLDYNNMTKVSKLIKKLRRTGRVIFSITHDYEFICKTCTRILHFDQRILKGDYFLSDKESKDKLKQFFILKNKSRDSEIQKCI